MRKISALLVGAVLVCVGRQAYAHDGMDDPNPNPPPTPSNPPSPTTPPTSPGGAETPTPQPPTTPTTPTPTPTTPTPAEPPAEPDLELHLGPTRPADMSAFAEQSAKETRVAGAKVRYSLNFFGDTFASMSGGTGDRRLTTAFGVGGFSFLFTGDLGNYVKATAEPAIEFNEQNEPGIDLERLHLRAKYEGFWVEAGRSHADFGYWNVAYHHGKWLQPTIERPRVVRFEDDGGVLPIHWIGVQVGYTRPLGGDLSVTASASVGNPRGAIVDDIQNVNSRRSEKQGYGKLELKGLAHRDLRIGVSGLYGRIPTQTPDVRPILPDTPLREYIGNAYIAFPSDPFFVIMEGYLISHQSPARSWETYSAFLVAGYAIPPVTPYIGVERLVMTNGLDPFFVPDPTKDIPQLDVVEALVGARFDVSTWSAVKAEYRLTRLPDPGATIHTVLASWQFGI